jgi:hypothetical protein
VPCPTALTSAPHFGQPKGSGASAPQWWHTRRARAMCTVMRASQDGQGAIQPQPLQKSVGA